MAINVAYNDAVENLSGRIFAASVGAVLGSGGGPPAPKLHDWATRAVLAARIIVDTQIGMGVFNNWSKDDEPTEGSTGDSEVHSTRSSVEATGAGDTKGNSGVVRKPSGGVGKTS